MTRPPDKPKAKYVPYEPNAARAVAPAEPQPMRLPAFEPQLVTLIDGSMAFNDSDAWRHECEARFVLNLPSLDDRRVWLFDLERRRGPEAVAEMKATMTTLHEAAKT